MTGWLSRNNKADVTRRLRFRGLRFRDLRFRDTQYEYGCSPKKNTALCEIQC